MGRRSTPLTSRLSTPRRDRGYRPASRQLEVQRPCVLNPHDEMPASKFPGLAGHFLLFALCWTSLVCRLPV